MGERYLRGNDVTTVNPARYWTDAIYKRDVDRAVAWVRIARDLDRVAYRGLVRAWLAGSRVGDTDSQGRYTVTERTLGHCVITLPEGITISIEAPVPLS